MKRGSMTTIVFLLVFLLLSGPVLAAVPWLVGYQGKVTDSEQVPLDGTYTMIFRLYSFEGATSPIWAEEQMVSVTDGVFQVQLGAGANLVGGDLDSTLITGQDRWLEIEIEGEVLSPRQQLTSAAYALRAETADSALRIRGALPSTITADDEGYALSVSNSGTGGAAELDGFVNVDHGNLLVQGDGSFDAGGEEGILYLGDTYNYIKAIRDFGVSIGTFVADDALVVQAGTGNVGIGVNNPTGGKLDVNGLISSRGAGLDCGVRMANPVGNRDYRMIQKDDGRLTITDETAHVERIIMDENGNIGIGTSPSQQLSVYGTIESKGGGFKFPDGSSQTSAGATQAYVSALETRVATLESKIATLENLLVNVTRSGNDITFSGVNVHVVNGTGTTDGTPNGLGNLIVGYNEARSEGNDRTGSHNIVVGDENNFSSYGGLIAGIHNTISGNYASVSGGSWNIASGGGASVSGGQSNTASAVITSVSGGRNNTASFLGASVSGGWGNTANYQDSSVSGGLNNTASGNRASISGGYNNIASGDYSFVGGGGHPNPAYGNVAFSNYSAVLGGSYNIAGDNSDPEDHSIGELATIAGGDTNHAKGGWSSITGGFGNTTESDHTSVSGGQYNMASGSFAIVSGGSSNQAVGSYSAVLGGFENIAGDSDPAFGWSSVSGGQHNTASGSYSFVGGGEDNHAFSFKSAIIGGHSNLTGGTRTHGVWSTIAGGEGNLSQGNFSSITGGQGNDTGVSSDHSSVIGGANNTADNAFDSVVGDAGAVYVDSTQVH